MDLDRRAIAGVLSLLLCCGTGGEGTDKGSGQWSWSATEFSYHQCSPAVAPQIDSYFSSSNPPPCQGCGLPWQPWPWGCCHLAGSCWRPVGDRPSPHSDRSPETDRDRSGQRVTEVNNVTYAFSLFGIIYVNKAAGSENWQEEIEWSVQLNFIYKSKCHSIINNRESTTWILKSYVCVYIYCMYVCSISKTALEEF